MSRKQLKKSDSFFRNETRRHRLNPPPPEIEIREDGIRVRLTMRPGHEPLYAVVDIDDYFSRVRLYEWKYDYPNGYARVVDQKNLIQTHHLLHRFIIRAKRGEIVDHINGDRLDCRSSNLRIVSAAENAINRTVADVENKTSRFKGIHKTSSGWVSAISRNGITFQLGIFETEVEAARAYDDAAKTVHGEFARTNEDIGLYDGPVKLVTPQPTTWLKSRIDKRVAKAERGEMSRKTIVKAAWAVD